MEKLATRQKAPAEVKEGLTAFISSVWNGEAGPESLALFDDLDDVLEVMAVMGEELPDIEDPTSF